jgi:DAACS family dicarboxylate/amino acid:cation (Na+ or H+) symporter
MAGEPYEREIVSDLDDKTDDRAAAGRRVPLHVRILLGLVFGAGLGGASRALVGADAPWLLWTTSQIAEPLGQLFLRLLLMTVVPLVFASLVAGTAGIGNLKRLGRVGVKTLAFTLVLSTISVLIGLSLANLVRPGAKIDPSVRDQLLARYGADAAKQAQLPAGAATEPALLTVVKTIVPTNPLESMARQTPDIIGVMFFALLFGAALTLLDEDVAGPVVRFFSAVFETMAKIIDMVMALAPVGVGCLLFTMTTRFGFGFLVSLGWYVATVLAGLALHMVVVYGTALRFLARVSPREFFTRIRTVVLTAFSTSSSNATLPTALRVSEVNLGIPREIGSFVLTVGATANQNGTALYEGVTVLFLAQLAGVDLSVGQQIMVVYLAILGGLGTAGVPSGSIPFVVAILETIGVNPALVAVIIGVDRLLDMCRTTLNVVGDLITAAVIARSEGADLLRGNPAMAAVVFDAAGGAAADATER